MPIIESPDSIFDLERIENTLNPMVLKHITNSSYLPFELPSDPARIVEIARALEEMDIDPRGKRLLDLGSGSGIVLATFALNGVHTYGIEQRGEVAEFTRKQFDEMSLEIRPEIRTGNYFDRKTISRPFSDGTTLRDMDFIYCFSYTEEHVRDVLDLLTGQETNPGLLANLCYDFSGDSSSELLKISGFENTGKAFWLRKAG